MDMNINDMSLTGWVEQFLERVEGDFAEQGLSACVRVGVDA